MIFARVSGPCESFSKGWISAICSGENAAPASSNVSLIALKPPRELNLVLASAILSG